MRFSWRLSQKRNKHSESRFQYLNILHLYIQVLPTVHVTSLSLRHFSNSPLHTLTHTRLSIYPSSHNTPLGMNTHNKSGHHKSRVTAGCFFFALRGELVVRRPALGGGYTFYNLPTLATNSVSPPLPHTHTHTHARLDWGLVKTVYRCATVRTTLLTYKTIYIYIYQLPTNVNDTSIITAGPCRPKHQKVCTPAWE